ncbi:hypothetical protein EJB05_56110, partial [Eragrostis curvula]
MDHDGADPAPGRPRQGPARGTPRRRRRRHGPGTRDLPRLHYLKRVIRESLRACGCTRPRHARTRVLVNASAIIGTDPAAGPLLPERHEEIADLSDHKPWHDSFALVPFGVGRRSCPGCTSPRLWSSCCWPPVALLRL